MNPPDGFAPIQDLPFDIGANRAVFNRDGSSLKLFGHKSEPKLWGTVRLQSEFTGPPGHVHGGAQAYVLDEAMGTVCWHANLPVMAREIRIEFLRVIPLAVDLAVRAEVVRQDGGDVVVTAEWLDQQGRTLARGEGKFHLISREQFLKLAPAWGGDLGRWFK